MFAVPKSSTMLFKSFCALVCKQLFTGDRPSLLLGKDLRSRTSSGFFWFFCPRPNAGLSANFPTFRRPYVIGKLGSWEVKQSE